MVTLTPTGISFTLLFKILGSLYLLKDLIVGGNSSRFGDFIVSELRKVAEFQSDREEPQSSLLPRYCAEWESQAEGSSSSYILQYRPQKERTN